ncbi:UDP-N-acetylglucosamine 4,6-dehydratase family protein [Paludisphaera soli]|uniref:UDP-N-acetylglucosamine 4,6-dehydratase family protein n=1 Tax=Paludisphaera soli TaxID=2712865 RepID=UPI0013ED1938|nr:nucleoside-diphosphate sugar epimerase/dehydratase [Paludisphaera soli]
MLHFPGGTSLIPSPGVSAREVREISAACRDAGLKVRVVPSFDAIVTGRFLVEPGRVDVRNILQRPPVVLDSSSVRRDVEGRSILITGAAGSIGSEICRQLLAFAPARLVLLDHSENGLFYLEPELKRAAGARTEIVPVVASIRDSARVGAVLASHRPDMIIHAAAHKHVPMMESNPGESVKTNVLGTRNLVDQALAHGVAAFVMVSTDKAVNPTSVMGACKRLAEAYVQLRSRETRSRLVTVRFGNVLGSNGSVVPTFLEQVRRGGPVCVTHPEITRYFMTIPEAAQLVLQAGSQGRGGEIFVLDMGRPIRIVDLARTIIRLSGQEEGRDVDIVFTGLRPGEKLHEELHCEGEEPAPTSHPKVRVARPSVTDPGRLLSEFDRLAELVDGPAADLKAAIADLVPGYRPKAVERHGPLPMTAAARATS